MFPATWKCPLELFVQCELDSARELFEAGPPVNPTRGVVIQGIKLVARRGFDVDKGLSVKELQINFSLQCSDSKRAKVEAAVSQFVRTLILLLNARSLHADFMISGEENGAWLNADFVPGRSSYLFLAASGRSHDVTRFKDSKWIQVAELCPCISSWMLTFVLIIWVFSRNLGAVRERARVEALQKEALCSGPLIVERWLWQCKAC